MLTATRKTDNTDSNAWKKEPAYETDVEDPYNCDWICPLCDETVLYVKRGADGTIAHFRHEDSADHPSVSEGKIHQQAKKKIAKKIAKDNNIDNIEIEKVIDKDRCRVADIFVETCEGQKIAIEIQCSLQPVEQFKSRTADYTDRDIHTLWILNQREYRYTKESSNAHGIERGVAFKEGVKWLQKQYYGRTYYFEPTDFEVQPARITNKEVIREGLHEDHVETLKTIGDLSTSTLPDYGIATTESNGYRIARFYDRCWWKERGR